MSPFIGREDELLRLRRLKQLSQPSLVVIKGRRRIGKSTLVEEFAKGKRFLSLSGIPPGPGITAQKQRDEFADQLCARLGLPRVTFLTWSDAFRFLDTKIWDEEMVILFDEISWMGDQDPLFLSSIKLWWDQQTKRKQLIFILCGSISTWIEENILSSTGFVGRIRLVIHLQSLSLPESVLFLKKSGFFGSIYEILKILSITGGVPWYLSLINPKETADQNIHELCFEPASQLINEFQVIFNDLFNDKTGIYRKILHTLLNAMKTQAEIREELDLQEGGTISKYTQNLVAAGFISEHYQWSFKKAALGKQKLYRLSDCFVRFHLKYVEPNRALIARGGYKKVATGSLPGWESILGFQVESLLLNNREFLFKILGIDSAIVLRDNPFVQSATTRKRGCQIDYLIQTNLNTFIICEFKFRKNELNSSIVQEVKEKCETLSVPKGYGKAAALFHVGGVSPKVEESGFFYKIIDLRDYL